MRRFVLALGALGLLLGSGQGARAQALPIARDAAAVDRGIIISANTTKTVCSDGCDFASLVAARDWVYGRLIVGNVNLTLKIQDGTYTETDQIFMQGDAWKKVRIVGNEADPGAVVINFPTDNNLPGFGATRGGGLAYLNGVTIRGTGARIDRTTWTLNHFGAAIAVVGSGSEINAGPAVVIDGFYYGVLADEGGRFGGQKGFTVRNSGDCNYLARHNGVISCPGCIAQTAAHLFDDPKFGGSQTLGYNFMAETGGLLNIAEARGTDAQVGGVGAITNGKGWVQHASFSAGQGAGVIAASGGSLDFYGSVAFGNAIGASVGPNGTLNMNAATLRNNAGDGVFVNGGYAAGTNVTSRDNGGYGFRSISVGSLIANGSVRKSGNNARGLSFVEVADPCSGPADTNCRPASLLVIN